VLAVIADTILKGVAMAGVVGRSRVDKLDFNVEETSGAVDKLKTIDLDVGDVLFGGSGVAEFDTRKLEGSAAFPKVVHDGDSDQAPDTADRVGDLGESGPLRDLVEEDSARVGGLGWIEDGLDVDLIDRVV
jgi:hypothetical protein